MGLRIRVGEAGTGVRELHGLATGLNRTHLLLSSSESDLKQPFSPRKMVTQRSVVLAASQMPAWFPFRAQGVCRSPIPGSTLLHLSPAGMRGEASTHEKAQAVQGGGTGYWVLPPSQLHLCSLAPAALLGISYNSRGRVATVARLP